MNNDNLNLYNIFIKTAETGSTLAASKVLFISQPAVSKALAKLESNLSTTLFTRSKKGVSLTTDGLILYNRIKSAFEYIDEGETILKERQSLGVGQIKIGASSTLCKYVLLPYLSVYTKKNPHISISIECNSSKGTMDFLNQNHVDLGLIAQNGNNPFAFLSLGQIQDTFVATSNYLSNMEKRTGTTEQIKANLMLLNKDNLTRQYIDSYIPTGFYDNFNLIEIDNMDLLIEFAKTGIGISSVIREFVKKEIEKGSLVEYDARISEIKKREVGFAYSYRRMPNPHVMDFLDFINSEKNNPKLNILL